MSQFPGILLTNAGLNMISESQATKTALIITAIKMGDGKINDSDDIRTLTAVKNPLLTAAVTSYKNNGNGEVMMRFTVSNSGLNSGFFAREIGIYAKLGDTGTEQLYAYTNAGNLVDYVPDKNTPYDDQIIDIYLVTGNASSVQVVMSGIALVTVYDLQDHNTDPDAHADLIAALRKAIAAGGLNLLKRSRAYAIGDVAYSAALPTWARLTCTVAGTTGEAEPAWGSVTEGGTVTDGTVTWLICDVKHALYA